MSRAWLKLHGESGRVFRPKGFISMDNVVAITTASLEEEGGGWYLEARGVDGKFYALDYPEDGWPSSEAASRVAEDLIQSCGYGPGPNELMDPSKSSKLGSYFSVQSNHDTH